MFFILSKALLFLLSPFFWMITSLGIYFYTKNPKWKKRSKWSALIVFVFFTNTVIFSEFCRLWEVPGTKIENVQHHDVAIVLGGMFEYNSDIDEISIRRQGDRLFQAITLYKTGKVDKLFISGDSGFVTDHGLHEAKQVKEVLIKWGIPEQDILTEEISINTHENAKETKKVLSTSYPHMDKFLLVTSGIHMKRALGCFEKQGMSCTPFSTDLYANQNRNYYWDQFLIPNVSTMETWNKLFKEIVGYITYDIVGYI
jgi:uncharacterized SAM-binding protein YcdF (DUF218 family)